MTTSNIGSEQREQMGQYRGTAGQTGETIKEQAKEMVDHAQEQTQEMLTTRKEQAVSELGNIAQAFRQTGDQLREKEQTAAADAITQVANQVERFSNYLSNKEITDLLDEAENLARRNPELFLGGAFALGLLASRFLKASARRPMQQQQQQPYRNYGYGYREQQQWTPVATSRVRTYSSD